MSINELSASNRSQTRPLNRAQEDSSTTRISAIAATKLSVVAAPTQSSPLILKSLEEAKFIEELDKWADTQEQSSLTNVEIAKQKILKCYQSNAINLDLTGLGLSSLPYCLFKKLTNLTNLCLNKNQLSSFDSTGLSNLTYLYLNNNQLTSFDGTGLTNLTHLSLGHNQITSFNGIRLTNLNYLILNNNHLTSFDKTGLVNLKYLILNNNYLNSFDGTGFTNLIHLNLDNNELTSLIGTEFLNPSSLSIENNPNITEPPAKQGRS